MLRHQISSSRKAAFTLVELLIVIIIIGILAGSVLLVAGSSTDKAHALKIVNNMKTIKKASMASYADQQEWPADMSDIAGYVDRGISDYTFEVIEESGLYIRTDLSDSSSGLKDRLSRMASEMGLYGNTDGSLVVYAGGDSVYYPLTKGYSGSDSLFTADFSNFSDQFESAQGGTLDTTWTIDDGVLRTTGKSGIALVKDFSGEDYSVNVTATYDGARSGYGIAYRAKGEAENGTFEGYVFQYDPGLNKAFVVRTRSGYSEPITTDDSTGDKAKVSMTEMMGDDFDIHAEHDISVNVEGSHHVISVDGVVILDFEDDTYTEGSAGLRTWNNDNSYSTFDNFEVTEN